MRNDASLYISGTVYAHRALGGGHYVIGITVPSAFRDVRPGQFVMVGMGNRQVPFLPRPFSVYHVDGHAGETGIEILYKIAGKGTRAMSEIRVGESLSVLGPLGTGFDCTHKKEKIILVAGGMGIAPLGFLAEWYSRYVTGSWTSIMAYVGAATSGDLVGCERTEKLCSETHVCTDDGSRGLRGTVVDAFRRDLSLFGEESAVYACGPSAMMKELSKLLKESSLWCQVSLEERMACGVGACLGCAIKTIGSDGSTAYKRVCTDGPVFNVRDILWE